MVEEAALKEVALDHGDDLLGGCVLVIINANNGDNTRDIFNKALVVIMKCGKIFERDAAFHVAVAFADAFEGAFGGYI